VKLGWVNNDERRRQEPTASAYEMYLPLEASLEPGGELAERAVEGRVKEVSSTVGPRVIVMGMEELS